MTLLFNPGGGAAVNGAVLVQDCTAVQPGVDAWAAALSLGGGTATCFDASSGANDPRLEITRLALGGGVAECRLNFRFPEVVAPGAAAPLVVTGPIVPMSGPMLRSKK